MSTTFLRRLVWNLIPAALVVGVLSAVLGGPDGLLRRHDLKQRLYRTQDQLQHVDLENRALRAEVWRLHNDPVTVERAATEALLVAEPGSTIYRFGSTDP